MKSRMILSYIYILLSYITVICFTAHGMARKSINITIGREEGMYTELPVYIPVKHENSS